MSHLVAVCRPVWLSESSSWVTTEHNFIVRVREASPTRRESAPARRSCAPCSCCRSCTHSLSKLINIFSRLFFYRGFSWNNLWIHFVLHFIVLCFGDILFCACTWLIKRHRGALSRSLSVLCFTVAAGYDHSGRQWRSNSAWTDGQARWSDPSCPGGGQECLDTSRIRYTLLSPKGNLSLDSKCWAHKCLRVTVK